LRFDHWHQLYYPPLFAAPAPSGGLLRGFLPGVLMVRVVRENVAAEASRPPLRILFCPASSGKLGYGEMARSSIIAQACSRDPIGAQVLFFLDGKRSKKPLYDFAISYYHGSRKQQHRALAQICREFRPDLVVFDTKLTWEKLLICRRHGARVINVAVRRKPVNKALRPHWLMLVDTTCVIREAGRLPAGWWGRFCTHTLGGRRLLAVDTIMAEPDEATASALLSSLGLAKDPFVLMVPGGGASSCAGRPGLEVFGEAAAQIGERLGIATVLVQGPTAAQQRASEGLCKTVGSLANEVLVALMARAAVLVAGGGDMLAQSAILGTPVIALPLNTDQPARIAAFAGVGAARSSGCAVADIVENVAILLRDAALRSSLREAQRQLSLINGLQQIVREIANIGERRRR
jgi:hypothetical protein